MANQSAQKPVVVLGGTGHYGRYIVKSLLKKGEQVRVLSRNVARARTILGEQPQILEGDLMETASVRAVLREACAVVICVSAFNWKSIRKLERIERDAVLSVLVEARKTGIARVVYLSVYEIREDVLETLKLRFPVARIKLEVERTLAASDLNWTILGLAPSMDIFFAMLRGNTMTVPGGGPSALPTVSPLDVGEITAQSVLRDDLQGQRFRVTGPEALSFPEAAERIAAATGRRIVFRKIPLLPLRIASILTRPFNPFLGYLVESVKLLNGFPQDVAQDVPADHQRLRTTFDYVPASLAMEAKRRLA